MLIHATLSGLLVLLLALPATAQVRNLDMNVYEVDLATGRGATVEAATAEARQQAIDETARKVVTQTTEEWLGYQRVRAAIAPSVSDLLQAFEVTDIYREDDSVVVEGRATVRRDRLTARLMELGIIEDVDKALKGAALPNVVVRPAGPADRSRLASFAVACINQQLSTRKLATVDASTAADLAAADQADNAAPFSGPSTRDAEVADIVVRVEASVEPGSRFGNVQLFKGRIEVAAYLPGFDIPVSTASYESRELSFPSGEDRNKSQKACIEEAVGGAIEPLHHEMMRQIKEERGLGRRYLLEVSGNPSVLDRIETFLSQNCSHLDRQRGVTHDLFTFRAKVSLEDVVEKLSSEREIVVEVENEGLRRTTLRVRTP